MSTTLLKGILKEVLKTFKWLTSLTSSFHVEKNTLSGYPEKHNLCTNPSQLFTGRNNWWSCQDLFNKHSGRYKPEEKDEPDMHGTINGSYTAGSKMKGNFSFSFHTFHKISTVFTPAPKATFRNLHGPHGGGEGPPPSHDEKPGPERCANFPGFPSPLSLKAVQNLFL